MLYLNKVRERGLTFQLVITRTQVSYKGEIQPKSGAWGGHAVTAGGKEAAAWDREQFLCYV